MYCDTNFVLVKKHLGNKEWWQEGKIQRYSNCAFITQVESQRSKASQLIPGSPDQADCFRGRAEAHSR